MTCRVRRPLATAALPLLLAGCSTPAKSPSHRTVTVFAAASLTESFTALGRRFEAAHDGATVRLVFGPSSDLARQIVAGADADVYAAASTAGADTLAGANLVDGGPRIFARNRLEIAVPVANPAHVAALQDLSRTGVKFAVCAAEVPCGVAAGRVLAAAGVTARPVTYERDVKAVLAKVRLGEVDAGLVYRTDIVAETRSGSGKVSGIEIPQAAQAVNAYPIVTVRRAGDRAAAQAFADFVLSADGLAILADAGFDAP